MIRQNISFQQISFNEAAALYNKYEHLGDPGLGVYHWGTMYGNTLIAAVSFGAAGFAAHRGVIANAANKFGMRVFQLTRGGTLSSAPLWVPSWTVSRGLRAIRSLKGDCLIAAYSDAKFNEIGTIYQACNFLYLGMTNPKNQSTYIIHGKHRSAWIVRRMYGTRCLGHLRKIDPEVKKIPLNPKYRYVFPCASPSLRRRVMWSLRPYAQPYPKRSVEGIEPMDIPSLVRRRVTKG
jgi:hypothetical protein